jgi:hypothetical protein
MMPRVRVCTPTGTTNAELLRLLRVVLQEVEAIKAGTGQYAPVESMPVNDHIRRAPG